MRLAAFSLYLAYLDMQLPPDILKAGRLPPLIGDASTGVALPLCVADAFEEGVLPDATFDVVVANPPWTEPSAGGAMASARDWMQARGLPHGDNNPSQLFLWRTLRLLRDDDEPPTHRCRRVAQRSVSLEGVSSPLPG